MEVCALCSPHNTHLLRYTVLCKCPLTLIIEWSLNHNTKQYVAIDTQDYDDNAFFKKTVLAA